MCVRFPLKAWLRAVTWVIFPGTWCMCCQFPSACAEESCHVIQQKYFFWKNLPMFLARDGEVSHLRRLVWYANFHSCSLVFQSLKSVKDLNTNNRQSLRICKFV